MLEFQEFERDIAGIPHTFRLNREEAKRRGLTWVEEKPAEPKKAAPANKAAKPADK